MYVLIAGSGDLSFQMELEPIKNCSGREGGKMCLLFLDKSVNRCVLSKDIIPPLEVTLPTQQATLCLLTDSQAGFEISPMFCTSSLCTPILALFVREHLTIRSPSSYGEFPD